ncbi:DUF1289 domain-containing protein [Pseudaquidulcibacter saccharophilus]|uniref:DUF1289 domain-containing protein n=1 Tax=Pseudaquidulcibacter saccharophilus TaxID=2831900 RepID=UPI001EFF1E6A|nr:DUF1289 domain-containing protein [Pseudaquidulcibacter saccharophilus]
MVCHIDQHTGLCLGCYRNIDEIGNWTKYSEQKRLEIMAELPGRKLEFNLP